MRTPNCVLPLLFVASASLASAEVRLRSMVGGAGSDVCITETPAGPWSPNGRIDRRTLNPHGDLHGDGRPSVANGSGGALVAWCSRAGNEVHLALGSDAWQSLGVLGPAAPGTTPVAAAIGDAWVVGWQALGSDSPVVTVVSQDGVLAQVALGVPGALVGARQVGQAVHALVLDLSSGRLTDVILEFGIPNPDPLPIEIIARVGLGFVTTQGAPKRTASFAARPVFADAGHGDTSIPVALWWRDAQTLEFAVLYEDGVGEVQQVTGRGEYSPSLVREALRLAALAAEE